MFIWVVKKSTLQKTKDDFWKNKEYFKGMLWQDRNKQIEATENLYAEMQAFGTYITSSQTVPKGCEDIHYRKIQAIQAASDSSVTGIYDMSTLVSIENSQTLGWTYTKDGRTVENNRCHGSKSFWPIIL